MDKMLFGWWWVKGDEGRAKPGILEILHGSRPKLKIMGETTEGLEVRGFYEADAIFGTLENHEKVTLKTLLPIKIPGSTTAAPIIYEVAPLVIFVGPEHLTQEKIGFDRFEIIATEIDQWVTKQLVKTEGKIPGRIGISYKPEFTLEADIKGLGIIKLVRQTEPEPLIRGNTLFSLEHKTKITLDLINTTFFGEYSSIIRHILRFFEFAINKEITPSYLLGIKPKPGLYTILDYSSFRLEETTGKRKREDIILRYDEISPGFNDYLNNWFAELDKFERIFNLVFSVLFDRGRVELLEHVFISLVSAIEGFINTMYDYKHLEKDGFKGLDLIDRIKSGLPDGIPQGIVKNIMNYLPFSNEYSFKQKIETLLKDNNDFLNSRIEDPGRFAYRLKELRNELVHGKTVIREKYAEELSNLVLDLRFIWEFLLLKHIGFSESFLITHMSNNPRFFYVDGSPIRARLRN